MIAAGVTPPKVVTAPNSDPQCFAPWASTTKLFKYPAKKGPYRIAIAKRAETRKRRIEQFVEMLARGETVHPQKRL